MIVDANFAAVLLCPGELCFQGTSYTPVPVNDTARPVKTFARAQSKCTSTAIFLCLSGRVQLYL